MFTEELDAEESEPLLIMSKKCMCEKTLKIKIKENAKKKKIKLKEI